MVTWWWKDNHCIIVGGEYIIKSAKNEIHQNLRVDVGFCGTNIFGPLTFGTSGGENDWNAHNTWHLDDQTI